MTPAVWRCLVVLPWSLLSAAMLYAGEADTKQTPQKGALPPAADVKVDFATQIGPIFAAHCVDCHGADLAEGSLRLDLPADALRGGNSGPAFEAGKSAESRLIHYVAGISDDGTTMPPDGDPLSSEQVALLRAWIDQGAVWPATATADTRRKGADHWAFQPIRRVEPPETRFADRVANPIDQFILARVEQEGFEPSPEADRFTQIRRLTLDLTGLPPTPEEVQQFIEDTAPGAYERLVERLLNSPHYGERWARHWLDLARYADSDGYEKDNGRPHAWRYRHWVIDALNRDMPFDEFTRWQLAGDLLPEAKTNPEALVATGFHRNTLRNTEGGVDQEEFRVAATVDRVNTTGAVWLGLTIGCAQCHSHKYDPITQREFYGLYAFFNSLDEKDISAPLAEQRAQYEAELAEFNRQHEPLVAALRDYERDQLAANQAAWEKRLASRSTGAWAPVEVVSAKATAGVELATLADGSVRAAGANPAESKYTLTVKSDLPRITAIRLEVLADDSLPKLGPGRSSGGNFVLTDFQVSAAPAVTAKGQKAVAAVAPIAFGEADHTQNNFSVAGAIDNDPKKTGWAISPQPGRDHVAVFELAEPIAHDGGAVLTVTLDHGYGTQHTIGRLRLSVISADPPVRAFGVGNTVAAIVDMPAEQRTAKQLQQLADYYRSRDPEWRKLNAAVVRHLARQPTDPAKTTLAQALVERDQPRDTHVLVRGDFLRPGAKVHPHVPEVFNPLPGSGDGDGRAAPSRVDLANWLLDPANPLTSRVVVNRLWQQYFGIGLVETENDFGTQGAPPSHPELLDWLASELMARQWSLKSMHRLIVTSATYRQSSRLRPELATKDPNNRLLARQSRLRFEAETVRDAALSISGLLVPKVGGPSVRPPQPAGISQLTYASGSRWVDGQGEDRYRRGLYTWFQRTSPYPMLMTFDAPDSNVTCTRRERSNTPLQALTLLNDPVFFECAQGLARRIVAETPAADQQSDGAEQRARLAVRICLARDPDEAELAELVALYRAQAALCRADLPSAELLVGDAPRPDGADVAELAAWVLVGRTLTNLDEFITRE